MDIKTAIGVVEEFYDIKPKLVSIRIPFGKMFEMDGRLFIGTGILLEYAEQTQTWKILGTSEREKLGIQNFSVGHSDPDRPAFINFQYPKMCTVKLCTDVKITYGSGE